MTCYETWTVCVTAAPRLPPPSVNCKVIERSNVLGVDETLAKVTFCATARIAAWVALALNEMVSGVVTLPPPKLPMVTPL